MLKIRGSDKKNIKIRENMPKEECEKHPAGNPISLGDGTTACLFAYDDEGKPISGIEIENITPNKATVKSKETGENVGELDIR